MRNRVEIGAEIDRLGVRIDELVKHLDLFRSFHLETKAPWEPADGIDATMELVRKRSELVLQVASIPEVASHWDGMSTGERERLVQAVAFKGSPKAVPGLKAVASVSLLKGVVDVMLRLQNGWLRYFEIWIDGDETEAEATRLGIAADERLHSALSATVLRLHENLF